MASRRSKRVSRQLQMPSAGPPRGLQEANNIAFPLVFASFRVLPFSVPEGPQTAQEAPKIASRRLQRRPRGAQN
eukprot:9489507-Pyramimonas_sp.AAC.1